jgi:anti-anti-sigma regulatory factor/HAMP domain-containing protein
MILNLGVKLNLMMVAVLAILLAAIVVLLSSSVHSLIVETGRQRVTQEVEIVQRQFDKAQRELTTTAKLLATTPRLAEAIAEGDAARSRAATLVGAATYGFDDIDVVDLNGARIVEQQGLTTGESTEESAQEDALFALSLLSISSTNIVVGDQELRLAAGVPIFNAQGTIVGSLVASRVIDAAFLDTINFARAGIHLALIQDRRILALNRTEEFSTTDTLVSAILLDQAATGQALNGQTRIADELVDINGEPYALAHMPLTVGGQTPAVIGLLVEVGEPVAFQTGLTNNLILTFALLALVVLGAMALFVRQGISVPLRALKAVAGRMAGGDYQQHAVAKTADEVGQLATAFNAMATTIRAQTHNLEQQVAVAQAARQEAEASQAEIAAQFATIEEQRVAIREMSVPILPLSATTLVMPLVGALDTDRLRLLQEQALRALEQTTARHLIMDITAVPVIDTQAAQGLIQVVQAARLLGTEVVLVGIRPEVAQSIVGLGVQFDDMITRSTLQSGIAYAVGRH